MLEKGEKLFEELFVEVLEKCGIDMLCLSGKDVFRFYDIFGFLVEIIEEVVFEWGVIVDFVGFELEMEI